MDVEGMSGRREVRTRGGEGFLCFHAASRTRLLPSPPSLQALLDSAAERADRRSCSRSRQDPVK